MSEQRLIDVDALKEKEQYIPCGNGLLFHGVTAATIDAMPTIVPETLPIVRELREKLEQTEQELRNVKYCYDIAKNGEKQLRRQVNEVTAEWAECVKKLERVTAERDSYKIFFNDITKCGDCNDCGKSATCEFVPKVGQTTRYNCPLWAGR